MRQFVFSTMTDDVIDSIADHCSRRCAVSDPAALREALTEQLAAHQEAAETVAAIEAMHAEEAGAGCPPMPPLPQRA